jgi:uncharacterized tellurite resistance protein B-like protein
LVTEATGSWPRDRLVPFTSLLNRISSTRRGAGASSKCWGNRLCRPAVTELEDNLLWRAADLLGVSSGERIELRQRVTGRDSGDP